MAIPNKAIQPDDSFGIFCDRVIVFAICASIFFLPASIAYLNSFAVLAIFFYLLKKIHRIAADWPFQTPHLNFLSKIHFIWKGFCPPVNCLNRPLQLLTLAMLLSVVFSQYPALSLFAFVGKFLKVVFLYFSFIEVFKDEKRIWIFLNCFLVSAFITALSGAVQHYTGKDFLKGHLIGTENFISTHRINSSFFGANAFGAYLLPVVSLVAHLLYTAAGRKKSWGWAAVLTFFLILLLACLCWTYSRSSWVGYLIILFVMILLDRRKIFYGGVLFLIFIFVFLPSLNNIRHENLISENNAGVQKEENIRTVLEQGGSGRAAYWKKAISIIRSSPIIGTGLNTYTRILKRNPDPKTWWYAHNCYLQLAAETGVIGLSCFLWMVFVLFRQGLSDCMAGMKDRWWLLALLQAAVAGLFGFLVQSFFDNTFYTVQLSMLMWLIFGLTVSMIRLNSSYE